MAIIDFVLGFDVLWEVGSENRIVIEITFHILEILDQNWLIMEILDQNWPIQSELEHFGSRQFINFVPKNTYNTSNHKGKSVF